MQRSDWILIGRVVEDRIRDIVDEAIAHANEGLWRHMLAAEEKIHQLEERMSAVDDMVAALDEATNEIARDLEALRAEVAQSDPVAAAKFQPVLDRLVAMGADPANPIP